MPEEAHSIAVAITAELQAAWNRADGESFGQPFAEDADFVDIRAERHQGRASIAAAHQTIFHTFYKGSTVAYEVANARTLAPGVISAQIEAALTVPSGHMAGVNHAVFSFVAIQGQNGWKIALFHNTLAPPQMDPGERQVRDTLRG